MNRYVNAAIIAFAITSIAMIILVLFISFVMFLSTIPPIFAIGILFTVALICVFLMVLQEI